MKKVACLLPLLLCILCFAGCVRFNTTVTIKSNGKADINMLYATVDSAAYSDSGNATNELNPELRQKYTDDGWVVEDYSKDGYTGHILSLNNVDLIDLSNRLKETNDLVSSTNNTSENSSENIQQDNKLNIEREGFKYNIKWHVFDDSNSNSMSQVAPYVKASNGYMKFTLNLPVKPASSNATSVSDDGKTLEWDLLALGEDGNVEVSFSLISVPMIIAIVVAVVMIVVVVIAIIVFSKKKKLPVEQQITESL